MSSGNTTYGNYYNWYAATAGSGTCAMTSDNASSSICPKGWRLPTGGSGRTSDFRVLYNNYSSASAMMGSPVNFVLSGYRNGSSTSYQDSQGYYWSSTAYSYSSDGAYRLLLNSSNVDPQNYMPKPFGISVRCVAQ